MLTLTLVQKVTIWVVPVLLAITLHEAAHAFVANYFGDSTAKMLGRRSLNPLRHIDIVGTIFVPLFLGILTQFQFVFGWAKPVPLNWSQLRNPRRDSALVALAGPLSNIIMAILWASLLKVSTFLHPDASYPALFLLLTAQAGILINIVLALLNLLPLPPLDGSRILASLLSPRHAYTYSKIEPYGLLILLALLFTGTLSLLLTPLLTWSLDFIYFLFKL